MFIRHGPILAEEAGSGNQFERRSYRTDSPMLAVLSLVGSRVLEW